MMTRKEFAMRIQPWFSGGKVLGVNDFDWLMKMVEAGIMPSDGIVDLPESAYPSPEIPRVHPGGECPIRDYTEKAAPIINTESSTHRPIPWGNQVLKIGGQEFLDGILWIESELHLSADNLIPCMKFESNINPEARNPSSSASGLIQFMDSTARNLGTTIEKIRKMDALQQLNYVYKYFRGFGADLSSWDVADTYMAILWPKGIGKPMDYRLFLRGTDSFRVNAGLDKNKDGVVTKAECAARILELQKQGFQEDNVLYI